MGCCASSLRELVHAEKLARPPRPVPQRPSFFLSAQQAVLPPPVHGEDEVPALAEFSLAELRAAMDDFAAGNIMLESGKKAPNLVYRGRLKGGGAAPYRSIPVNEFSKLAWIGLQEEARGVGKLRHWRLANLIGYCCNGDFCGNVIVIQAERFFTKLKEVLSTHQCLYLCCSTTKYGIFAPLVDRVIS
jgi:BR-signaling kinase